MFRHDSQSSSTSMLKPQGRYCYSPERKLGRLCLSVPCEGRTSYAAQILVIDKSGSMAGNALDQVKKAVKYLEGSAQNITILMYSSDCQLVDISAVAKTTADGMTDFVKAFQQIQAIIGGKPASTDRISVMFMTDGEDTVNTKPIVQLEAAKLSKFIQKCDKEVIFHAMGFTQSHNLELLTQLTNIGTKPGVYRYAESKELKDKFEELFDFVEFTLPLTVTVPVGGTTQTFKIVGELTDHGTAEADVWLSDAPSSLKSIAVSVILGGKSLTLDQIEDVKPDAVFEIAVLSQVVSSYTVNPDAKSDESQTVQMDTSTLHGIQAKLNHIKVFGAGITKDMRGDILSAKAELQARLDVWHSLMATQGRNESVGVLAKMNDLRYAAQFTKTRRQRLMNMRISKNSSKAKGVSGALAKLKTGLKDSDFDGVDLDTFHCDLTQESVKELMMDDMNEVMGFGLNISRPEHSVDAPTLTVVNEVSATIVAKSAVEDAIRWKINIRGAAPEDTHGGFCSEQSLRESKENGKSSAFAGRGREPVNAFMPMYICDAHWNRVKAMIEPILGYFFTLDPLGYEQNQIMGLYMVLGSMLVLSEKTQRHMMIVSEFAKVCRAMLPDATRIFGQDLVTGFASDPANRTKGALQNLLTLVGWTFVRNERTILELTSAGKLLKSTPVSASEEKRPGDAEAELLSLRVPLIEESIRRQLSYIYHTVPRPIVLQVCRILLYGDDDDQRAEKLKVCKTAEQKESLKASEAAARKRKAQEKEIDQQYADWAKFKLKIKKDFVHQPHDKLDEPDAKNVVQAPGGVAESHEGADEPPFILPAAHKTIQSKITELLAQIKGDIADPDNRAHFLAASSGSITYDVLRKVLVAIAISPDIDQSGGDAELMRAMLVQSLRFHSNTLLSSGVSSGTYLHTAADPSAIVQSCHSMFEQERKESADTLLRKKRDLLIARRAVMAPEIWTFIGRLLHHFPTRGGPVWDDVVALLQDKSDKVPDREAKIRVIFLGNISYNDKEYPVLAAGNAWATTTVEGQRFKDVLSKEAFVNLELSMRGRVCNHVYRLSDLENRHGHCNSKPNLNLAFTFKGFTM